MRLKTITSISNVSTLEDLRKFASIMINDIRDLLNGFIEFDSNIRSQTIDITFSATNTDTSVSHNLRFVPKGFLLAKSNVAANIYDGSVAWTSTEISLRSDAVANVKIILF